MLPGRCCHDSSSLLDGEWANANGSVAAASAVQTCILMDVHRLNGFKSLQMRKEMERKNHLPSYPDVISIVIP